MISGRMKFVMAELAALPRAAVVVEEGYRKIFKHSYVAGSAVAEQLAEIQAQFPAVPIVFCETRQLAEEWTYRWLGACQYELELAAGTSALEESSVKPWRRTPLPHRCCQSPPLSGPGPGSPDWPCRIVYGFPLRSWRLGIRLIQGLDVI